MLQLPFFLEGKIEGQAFSNMMSETSNPWNKSPISPDRKYKILGDMI